MSLQKARLARIRIAKASSGAAFVSKKKAAEARWAAQESGIELDDNYRDEDIFELQHHHLLRCLEKTTVRIRDVHCKCFVLRPAAICLYIYKFINTKKYIFILYIYEKYYFHTTWRALVFKFLI